MKTRTILVIAMLSFSAIAVTSCNKAGDTTKPIIELHTPEDGGAFEPGSELCIEMDLSDDTALSSYKINIHDASGHSHSKSVSSHSDDDHDTAGTYEYNINSAQLKDETIAGSRNAYRDIDIDIPADVPHGDYHLMVYCTDMAGNESHVVRTITFDENAQ